MGRKPYATAKNMDRAPLVSKHEEMRSQKVKVQYSNIPSDLKESQPESAIPVPRNENTPLQQPGFSVDQVGSTVVGSRPVMETGILTPETQLNVSKSRKKPKIVNSIVRRSMRVQNAITTTSSLEKEPIVEEVTIDDDPVADHDDIPPERSLLGTMTLEEKLNHVLRKLEEQEKIMDMLQSKINGSSGMDENSFVAYARYRSMYVESQNRILEHQTKIEALTMENQHLTEKLENTLGQVEAFEKQGRTMIEAVDKMKDAFAISNLIKTMEATLCAAITNATQTALSKAPYLNAAKEHGVSGVKRKRDAQDNRTD